MYIRMLAKRLTVTAALLSLAVLSVAPRAATPPPPIDLIQDRPTLLANAWDYSVSALGWAWDVLHDNVLDWVTPPSPTAVTSHVTQEDAVGLFKLLGDAGYKVKEIETHVGIIPTMSFKFGQVRELSEADFDYLNTEAHDWYLHHPGMGTALQQTIVDTVIAVNQSIEYQVSSLKVQLLPLPKVAFTVSPKALILGEENSALMRAIQRVERNLLRIRRENQL